MRGFWNWTLKRLAEPSTWAGLAGVAGAVGFPGMATGLGAVAVFMREKSGD